MKMDDSVGWMLNDGEEESRGGEGTADRGEGGYSANRKERDADRKRKRK